MSVKDTMQHIPVMCAEVLEALRPRDGGTYVDGTFGAGGYTRAILEAAACQVIAIDRDREAIAGAKAMAKAYAGRLSLREGRFADMRVLVDNRVVDGVTLDLGVSSMQLDHAERGFSFRRDGPLDMRMNQGPGTDAPSAADVVNQASEGQLVWIISVLGEEERAKAVARAIIRMRDHGPITSTMQLAELVERAVPVHPAKRRIHPATRTFQALRIFVNRELEELAEGLAAAEELMAPGARLAVVSFHSLEDRIVKRFLAERTGRTGTGSRHMPETVRAASSFRDLSRKPIMPSQEEAQNNPRARSARLRVGERTDAPAIPMIKETLGVPSMPDFKLVCTSP